MRNELTKRIFMACMVVFVMCFGLMLFVMDRTLADRNLTDLKNKALTAARLLNAGNDISVLKNQSVRTILVAPDGSVLYDSVNDALGTNLSDREEIQKAFASGEGTGERFSDTMRHKTAYYAILLQDGNVLRISMTQNTVLSLLVALLNPMILIVLTAILLSFMLASQFSRKIMQPINRMDVENPDDRDIYDEMKPFIRRLMSQNQQIHHQMEALQEEHRKQDSMRRELTANISHELKTPLTSISGFAEIMRDGMVQAKDIPHFSDNIYREAQRLITLVNDILKLSRLEDIDASPTAEHAPVELLGLCREVAGRLALPASKSSITLSCEGAEVSILGVQRMLEDIVYNVCDNAIKYNRPGGFVHMTVHAEGEKAVIRVKDNGIGIPAADQERIFERFYRVNKSHSKEVGGTGLGLSIVKHGMALHNGEITLESIPNEGTTIGLVFPKINEREG